MSRYMVEQLFIYGWDDAGWHADDSALLFDSVEEAQEEIDEVCKAMDYDASEYRIVEVRA